VHGRAHGGCEARGIGAFAFNAVTTAILKEQQIKLRLIVRCPEIRIFRRMMADGFLNRIAFPGGAQLRVCMEVRRGADAASVW
jgi:hypothetical protein